MYLFCKHITAVVTQVGCHTKTIPIGTSYQDLSFTLNCFALKIIALKKMLTPQNWCKYTKVCNLHYAWKKSFCHRWTKILAEFYHFETQQNKPLLSAQVNCNSIRCLTPKLFK